MTKTLRTTSITTVIAAVVLFISPAVMADQNEKAIKELLKSPGAVEKYKQEKGNKESADKNQESPLVKQAKAYALYLNPPKIEKNPTNTKNETKTTSSITAKKPASVSAKFKLIGTSFYESNPKMSLALIDIPGKGFRWIQQSEKVGYLTIEEVKDGTIVIRDGDKISEMTAERMPRKSLIKGKGSPISNEKSGSVGLTDEENAMAEKIFAELAAMGADSTQPSDTDDAAKIDAVKNRQAMRIQKNEAKRLKVLGDKLKKQKNPPKPRAKEMTEEERAMAERMFAELEKMATSEQQRKDANSPPEDGNSENQQ